MQLPLSFAKSAALAFVLANTAVAQSSSASATAPYSPGITCGIEIDICMGAPLIQAFVLNSADCPTGTNLLCTVTEVVDILTNLLQPVVEPVIQGVGQIVGNGQILGLSISPGQLQLKIAESGGLDALCGILPKTPIILSDPACYSGSSSSTSATRPTMSMTSNSRTATTMTTATRSA